MANKTPRITLYSAPGCTHCRQAKEWLRQHKVPFVEFNVRTSTKAMKQLERMGARGVPVIMIGDNRVNGFDATKLKKALQSAKVLN